MMLKSAQPGEGGGGVRPPPFILSTNTSKVVVFAPAERADTLPFFLLYPCMYSVWATPVLDVTATCLDLHLSKIYPLRLEFSWIYSSSRTGSLVGEAFHWSASPRDEEIQPFLYRLVLGAMEAARCLGASSTDFSDDLLFQRERRVEVGWWSGRYFCPCWLERGMVWTVSYMYREEL
jgi:hypothetical protein